MEEKNYKGLVWLVVILVVLVLVLMGFIVYREFYSKEKPNVDNTTTTTNNVVNNNENQIKTINDFPKENSNGIKEFVLKTQIFGTSVPDNFDDKIFYIDDIKFNAVCVNKEEADYDNEIHCVELEYYLDNNMLGSIDLEIEEPNLIITDKYIIIQDGTGLVSNGDIRIFDKTGKLLKTISNTYKTVYLKDEDGANIDTTMKIVNNKLYYIVSMENFRVITDVTFKYLDLETLNEHTIQDFKGYVNQQE